MSTEISEDDKSSLEYFWKEKDDVKRWAGWKDFANSNPQFVIRVEEYERSLRNARLVFEADLKALGCDL